MSGSQLLEFPPNLQHWHNGRHIDSHSLPSATIRALNDTSICTTSTDCFKSSFFHTTVGYRFTGAQQIKGRILHLAYRYTSLVAPGCSVIELRALKFPLSTIRAGEHQQAHPTIPPSSKHSPARGDDSDCLTQHGNNKGKLSSGWIGRAKGH